MKTIAYLKRIFLLFVLNKEAVTVKIDSKDNGHKITVPFHY